MNVTKDTWAIIINPKSGKRNFGKELNFLIGKLEEARIQFDYRLTEFAGHATKIAKHFAELGYQNFLVVGGDGTISEVINGIFSPNTSQTNSLKIAIIPRGTGNDWARFWGITRNYKHSIDVFLKANTQLIDIGKVEFELEGERQVHYFINSVGFGLDAAVVKHAHHLKHFMGSHRLLYFVAMLGAVFTYRAHDIHLISKEKELNEKMFTMNVANGCYSGGGMKQTPYALPYDGLLDLMMAKKPNFWDIVTAIRNLFNGKLLEHRVIESFKTNEMTIDCPHNALMEADGILVHGASPYTISILPNAIQMIVP